MRYAAILALLWAWPALAGNLYVSPTGSDSFEGSADWPWASLYQAARVAKSGDTIWLRGGTYYVHAARRVVLKRGLADVRIRAAPGERPNLVAPGLDYCLTFSDNARILVEGIGFEGIRQPVRIGSDPNTPGARQVTLRGLRFTDCGTPGTRTNGRAIQVRCDGGAPPAEITIAGCAIDGASEIGIYVLGPIEGVTIADTTIRRVDDGCGAGGDGDGITVHGKDLPPGQPTRITIRDVTVEDCSEDGLDLTATACRVQRVSVRRAGACGVKLWSRAGVQGDYELSAIVTAECAESGLKASYAPNVTLAHSTIRGGEWGLRFLRQTAAWPARFSAEYCLFAPTLVRDGSALTSTTLVQCASPAGGPGLIQADVRPADLRADFNGDGKVDGLDFLRWQAGRGDANGDGATDGLDFLIWQAGCQ